MSREHEERIRALDRPDPALWTYYILGALPTLVFPPLFLVVLFLGWVRYSTLRYTFTAEGVSMRWGRLFRREIILNYARIQDIHVSRNIFERWLGIGTVQIQTASGSSSAEESITGIRQFHEIRNFLYARMRGHQLKAGTETAALEGVSIDDILKGIRDELRVIRELMETRRRV